MISPPSFSNGAVYASYQEPRESERALSDTEYTAPDASILKPGRVHPSSDPLTHLPQIQLYSQPPITRRTHVPIQLPVLPIGLPAAAFSRSAAHTAHTLISGYSHRIQRTERGPLRKSASELNGKHGNEIRSREISAPELDTHNFSTCPCPQDSTSVAEQSAVLVSLPPIWAEQNVSERTEPGNTRLRPRANSFPTSVTPNGFAHTQFQGTSNTEHVREDALDPYLSGLSSSELDGEVDLMHILVAALSTPVDLPTQPRAYPHELPQEMDTQSPRETLGLTAADLMQRGPREQPFSGSDDMNDVLSPSLVAAIYAANPSTSFSPSELPQVEDARLQRSLSPSLELRYPTEHDLRTLPSAAERPQKEYDQKLSCEPRAASQPLDDTQQISTRRNRRSAPGTPLIHLLAPLAALLELEGDIELTPSSDPVPMVKPEVDVAIKFEPELEVEMPLLETTVSADADINLDLDLPTPGELIHPDAASPSPLAQAEVQSQPTNPPPILTKSLAPHHIRALARIKASYPGLRPSAKSRRAWALARGIDPASVHRWFHRHTPLKKEDTPGSVAGADADADVDASAGKGEDDGGRAKKERKRRLDILRRGDYELEEWEGEEVLTCVGSGVGGCGESEGGGLEENSSWAVEGGVEWGLQALEEFLDEHEADESSDSDSEYDDPRTPSPPPFSHTVFVRSGSGASTPTGYPSEASGLLSREGPVSDGRKRILSDVSRVLDTPTPIRRPLKRAKEDDPERPTTTKKSKKSALTLQERLDRFASPDPLSPERIVRQLFRAYVPYSHYPFVPPSHYESGTMTMAENLVIDSYPYTALLSDSEGVYIGREDELTWGCGMERLDESAMTSASYGLIGGEEDEGGVRIEGDWEAKGVVSLS
ncbi:hypothetical protein BOTBODRAFT_186770 [Botryobasidium botryosum FD-172 SS1]|uniref:Uncharacterized protein n=1 Tax=Botryobasidium botryosum (strain FD-172 SS1) TaxID=930990 RepID=A0A067MKI8_BOTB1|nr:hypothetical protein BOTBODRAFT_186770 [Botryobasidium botryosum FD-172 SS1]